MPFTKGNNGYPAEQKKARQFRDMLNVALADDKGGPGVRLRKIADNLVKQAQKGEAWAIKEVADRLDGKPAHTVRGSGYEPPSQAILDSTSRVKRLAGSTHTGNNATGVSDSLRRLVC